jgi:hypothetical protein
MMAAQRAYTTLCAMLSLCITLSCAPSLGNQIEFTDDYHMSFTSASKNRNNKRKRTRENGTKEKEPDAQGRETVNCLGSEARVHVIDTVDGYHNSTI